MIKISKSTKRIVLLITYAVIIYTLMKNLGWAYNIALTVLKIIFPFILGGCLAFAMGIPMNAIERLIDRPLSKLGRGRLVKLKRPISMLVTLVCGAGIIAISLILIIPELVSTFESLAITISSFLDRVQGYVDSLNIKWPAMQEWISQLEIRWEQIGETIFNYLKSGIGSIGNIFTLTATAVISVMQSLVGVVIGIIFAMYLLFSKEKIGGQIVKLMSAFFPEKVVNRTVYIASLTHRTFSKFIAGQCLEAVILGTMFFIAMSILKMPYALIISIVIAFMALIPIFGAFIGCIFGAFLILMVDPMTAVWFVVLFLVLQQIEGNLIYPHVVGGRVGLPSIWVLVAVTLGGSLFGVAGMLFFIPLCSVLYTLLREKMYKNLEKKRSPGTTSKVEEDESEEQSSGKDEG